MDKPPRQEDLNKINSSNLDTYLLQDKEKCEAEDTNTMWYHGKISRNYAEQMLREAMQRHPETDSDGLFLVRDSTASEVDFSLTFMFQNRAYHFYIKRQREGYYCIEGGPEVHGLDKLIQHYTESANRLPTQLTKLCKSQLPPPKVRKSGPTNLLHRTIKEGRLDLVKKILEHNLCPDVNARNEEGSTALHDAAEKGMDEAVTLLLKHGADVTMKDNHGSSPLHKACNANKTSTAVVLITHNNACVQDTSPDSKWTPLHVAAMKGHIECCKILLNAGAALYSRDKIGKTPVELAEEYRRTTCVELLENYKEQPVSTHKSEWFHPELDRQGAENVFNNHQALNGVFIIRPNKNIEGQHVLSLCKDRNVFHYEIKTHMFRNQLVHYIDDGPYHRSLELLVQYYNTFEDGLGVPLRVAVSTANELIELNIPETYSNLTSPKLPVSNPFAAQGKTKPPKPKLPKRPDNLDPRPPVEAPPTPEIIHNQEPQEEEKLKEIEKKNLKMGKEIGQGEYGSVLRGTLVVGKKLFKEKHIEVAIKTFHSLNSINDLKTEAHVMQSLKSCYIVELLGICLGPPLMLVEEFVPMGSMLDYLENHPSEVRVKEELYLWAAQIARGMVYLETKRLVHRDLAARNILLQSLKQIKISDFGLSRAMGSDKDYYKASKGGRWPIKWYAPESVNFGHFDHASDVWSYGVTLWEMFSYGGAPFEDMTGVEVIKFIEDGHRLSKPEKCPEAVYEVMLQCWSYQPADRPTFQSLDRQFAEDPEYMSAREIMEAMDRR